MWKWQAYFRQDTLYTGPKPPLPSILAKWKLFVAVASISNSNRGSSSSLICFWSPVIKFWGWFPEYICHWPNKFRIYNFFFKKKTVIFSPIYFIFHNNDSKEARSFDFWKNNKYQDLLRTDISHLPNSVWKYQSTLFMFELSIFWHKIDMIITFNLTQI